MAAESNQQAAGSPPNKTVRFVIGFALGAAASSAAVVLFAPRSGRDTLQAFSHHVQQAIETGRQAAASEEHALWADFQQRLRALKRSGH
jgi:gas vesicle protein